MNKKAIIYMLLSTGAFAFMNIFVKHLNDFPALQLVFFRSVGALIFGTTYLLWKRIPLLGNQKKLLLSRGLTGTLSMALFFYALKFMPLGSAVTLRYLSPIFGIILAIYFLKERVSKNSGFIFSLL